MRDRWAFRLIWWALQDSNLRPLPCEAASEGWQHLVTSGNLSQSRGTHIRSPHYGSARSGRGSSGSCCILAARTRRRATQRPRGRQAAWSEHADRLPPLRARRPRAPARELCNSNRARGGGGISGAAEHAEVRTENARSANPRTAEMSSPVWHATRLEAGDDQ